MSTPTSISLASEQVRDDRAVVAVAWPTGRLIYAYTPAELAAGVDIYTQHLKATRRPKRGVQDA
jgi:hypothetical protein